jgi:hypothetical protein
MKYPLLLLALLANTVQAEVYKSLDANGEVIYSDVPSVGAKRMQMPELPTYTPAPLPAFTATPDTATATAGDGYSALALSQPRDDETIRSNGGTLNVSVTLEPALQVDAGHRVQFFLDDKARGKPLARLSTSFTDVDRGTHTVSAAVIDESGASIITAGPVKFHLLRASLLQPANPLNPARQGGGTGGSTGSGAAGGTGSAGGASPPGSGAGSSGTVTRSPSL